MTSSPALRRRATSIGASAAVVGLVLVVVLALLGAATLADSRAGRDVTVDPDARLALPVTHSGVIGVIDDDGVLTSVVVIVLHPDGVGGSVVVVPPTADHSFLRTGEVFPVREVLADEGPDTFVSVMEAASSITFDTAELVTGDRLVRLFDDVGSVTVDAPSFVPDGVDLAPGQTGTIPAADAARALSVALPASDRTLDPFRVAVWTGLVTHAGSGTGRAAEDLDRAPRTTDELLERLVAGRVGVRALRAVEATPDVNPRAVDAVVLDRSEMLLVMGQLAPGRVAVPNPLLSFRVEVNFSDEQLAPFGVSNADVARDVISVLLFLQANVVSVDTSPGVAPSSSQAAVADPDLVDQVADGWRDVFGPIDIAVAEIALARVDATITLGEAYLDLRSDQLRASGSPGR